MNRAVEAAIAAAELAPGVAVSSLAGGCMHVVELIDLADGDRIVCKRAGGDEGARMLHSEAVSLRAIAHIGTLTTPRVLGLHIQGDTCVLMTQWLEPGSSGDWEAMGRALAQQHRRDQGGQWGYAYATWLGRFEQPNGPLDDWHAFMRQCRLEPQIKLAQEAGLLPTGLGARLERLVDDLHERLPVPAQASLLHGDLWGGNCHMTAGGDVAVLDPAVWCGDAWADIAMAKLFGGVPERMIDAWRESWFDHEGSAARIAVHQLYHMLNHLNLFGTGYLGGVESALGQLD